MTDNHIDALLVDDRRRGMGLGRSLIDRARGGATVLTVDVNEQNEQAVRFYERLDSAERDVPTPALTGDRTRCSGS